MTFRMIALATAVVSISARGAPDQQRQMRAIEGMMSDVVPKTGDNAEAKTATGKTLKEEGQEIAGKEGNP